MIDFFNFCLFLSLFIFILIYFIDWVIFFEALIRSCRWVLLFKSVVWISFWEEGVHVHISLSDTVVNSFFSSFFSFFLFIYLFFFLYQFFSLLPLFFFFFLFFSVLYTSLWILPRIPYLQMYSCCGRPGRQGSRNILRLLPSRPAEKLRYWQTSTYIERSVYDRHKSLASNLAVTDSRRDRSDHETPPTFAFRQAHTQLFCERFRQSLSVWGP